MGKVYAHYRDYPRSAWRWRNFTPAEMACRGTGKLMIDAEAMDRLQALRDQLDAPMIVRSAYRSPEHNNRVGGAAHSEHLKARAFDIAMGGHDPHDFEALARQAGFTGFGFYPHLGFMHIDTGREREWGDRWPYGEDETPAPAPRILIGAEAEAKRAEVAEAIREAIGPKTALKRKRPAAA